MKSEDAEETKDRVKMLHISDPEKQHRLEKEKQVDKQGIKPFNIHEDITKISLHTLFGEPNTTIKFHGMLSNMKIGSGYFIQANWKYWVSQGKKWCDLCKIFISNNPSSIRNHELGQRHKDAVTKRLSNMRDEKVAKDKQKKETERVLTQIEEKATRSYANDISTFQKANSLGAPISSEGTADGSTSGEWEHDTSSGYYYNKSNGCYYDPNSGFYYTDALGKWVTQEEAFAAASKLPSGSIQKKPMFATQSLTSKSQMDFKSQRSTVNSAQSVNKPSSLAISKRKRVDTKSKVVSEEEAAALKAREAARKRVEEREKSSLGLYKH